jgi:hypothetical protein
MHLVRELDFIGQLEVIKGNYSRKNLYGAGGINLLIHVVMIKNLARGRI